MDHCIVYITTPNIEEARKIASVMVVEKLAACANILPGMESVYSWENKINFDQETVLLLKTIKEHVDLITRKVGELHSYDLPCVVSIPIEGGSPDFLKWITDETEQR